MPDGATDYVLERIANLVRAEQRRLAAEHGLSTAQLEALHYLTRCNRYSDTPLGVADYLGTTKGTASQSLAALETKGLIKKTTDPDDGRMSHCHVTAAGKRLAAKCSLDAHAVNPIPKKALIEVLHRLQVANDRRTFGACHSCIHFRRRGRGQHCGLTGETLRDADVDKICREHEPE